MAFTGAYLTIIYTVLLHFTIAGTNSWIFDIMDIGDKYLNEHIPNWSDQ